MTGITNEGLVLACSAIGAGLRLSQVSDLVLVRVLQPVMVLLR